LEYYR